MKPVILKSAEFRREREGNWRDLDRLVTRMEKSGLKSLSASEALRLPSLYRATLSALSVARAITLDRSLISYLEVLAARSYFCVYGPREGPGQAFVRFFRTGFPAAVREARQALLVAFLILTLAAIAGFGLTTSNPDWYYSFVSEGLAGDRTPTSTAEGLREGIYDEEHDAFSLTSFAAYLFSHNSRVAMFCLALGFALGIPTAVILVMTGTMLGAFLALYHSKGLGLDMMAWLAIHGTTEILAILLCAAAGFRLAAAIIFPGKSSRLDQLRHNGRGAAVIAMGAVMMLLIAGLLEGFGRQLITDLHARGAIGLTMLLFWVLYLGFAGRRGDDHGQV